MLNTRSKTSKQRHKGKQIAIENPPGGSKASPEQMSGENSVRHMIAPQFVATEQLGKALRRVQEVVIRGVCEKMKTSDQQTRVERGLDYGPAFDYGPSHQQGQVLPRVEPGSAFKGNVRSMVEGRQALQKAHVSVAPSKSVITPYMSGMGGVAWYVEQEESSHSQHDHAYLLPTVHGCAAL